MIVAIIDTEATSTDAHTAELIEVATMLLTVDHRGDEEGHATVVFDERVDEYSALNQPASPIPQDVVDLTGITDDLVEGRHIDVAELTSFLRRADVVVAHNAAFDRTILERYGVPPMRWACSCKMIDWKRQLVGASLPALAREFRLPYTETHRAMGDVQTLEQLLGRCSRWEHRRTHPTFLAELLAALEVDRGVLLMRIPRSPRGLYPDVKAAVPDARWCKSRNTLWWPCTRQAARAAWHNVARAYGSEAFARQNVSFESVDITTDYEAALGLNERAEAAA